MSQCDSLAIYPLRERGTRRYIHTRLTTDSRLEVLDIIHYFCRRILQSKFFKIFSNCWPYWLIKVTAIPDYLRAQFRGLDIDPKEFLCVSPINGKKHNVMSVLEEKSLSSHIL